MYTQHKNKNNNNNEKFKKKLKNEIVCCSKRSKVEN